MGTGPLLFDESREIELVTPLTATGDGAFDHSMKILHVDDDSAFLDLAQAYLDRIRDQFTVITATSAATGLEWMAEEDIDCIVSDYQMPGKDGLEFLEAIRANHPQLPFILYTGQGSEEIASDAIAAGVTDYLQKGGGSEQYEVLANRVENAIDRYRTHNELHTTLSWYQRLVEQNLAGIYLIQQQEFVYVNRKLAAIFGYDKEELIGTSPAEVVAEEDHEELIENLRKREAGELDSVQYSLTGERKDGSRVPLEAHGGTIEFHDEPAVLGVLLQSPD